MEHKDKGMALILAVAIVGILAAIGISFAFNMKLNQNATENYMNEIKARYLAEAGIARAMAILLNTATNTYDSLNEGWDNISGTLVYGNYSVTITDESGKININTSGNLKGAGLSHSSNEGYTTFEISIEDFVTARYTEEGLSSPPMPSPNDVAQGIINYRQGSDGGPGISGTDDDSDNAIDGIDNDGDNTIDEANENLDEPDEFCMTNPVGDDMPFKMIEEVKCCQDIGNDTYSVIKDYITVYSYDKIQDSSGGDRINVNNDTALMIDTALQQGGMAATTAGQVAVNIVDYVDSDSIPTTYLTYLGREDTPYINEIMADTACPDTDGDDGEFIELYNPWPDTKDVGGWVIKQGGVTIATIPAGTNIPPDGYLIITDQYNDDPGDPESNGGDATENYSFVSLFGTLPAGVVLVEVSSFDLSNTASTIELRDDADNLIDRASYNNASQNNSQERNDPRVDYWIPITGQTAGSVNISYSPGGEGVNFYIKNKKMANIGEIGFIHTGDQWTTVKLQSGGDWGILDYVTVSDPRYDNFDNDNNGTSDDNTEIKIYGRININTASKSVLQSLPGITSTLADAIITYRRGSDNIDGTADDNPYDTIGEILEVPGMGSGNVDDDGDGYIDENDEESIFRKISNLITVRSNTFKMESTGTVINTNGETLAEKKIVTVVDRGVSPMRYLYYREDIE